MKNAFYFTLKALFVLKIFSFLSWLFGHIEKQLNKKDEVISKFVTSQRGYQSIAIDMLTNLKK